MWNKVACDGLGNVIKLNLDGYTEDNTLLPNSSIFKLRYLQNLTFGNDDHGPFLTNSSIPTQIGKLTELRNLIVYGFRGPIPPSIGSLTKLQTLFLALTNGGMAGNIPDSIGNLRQLTSLDLTGYDFSGSIPGSFRSLTKLVRLTFGRGVTGNLPSFIFDFPNLETLFASNNRLQGSLPRNIGPHSKLKLMFLDNNNLTGVVPAWIFTRSLVSVFLENNSFSGPIEPFRMPRVSNMKFVDLSDNRIEGMPTSLFYLKNVEKLLLAGNKLSGALDFELIGGMKKLESLHLSGNEGLTLKRSTRVVQYSPFLWWIQMDHCGLTEFPNFLSSVDSLGRLEVNDNKMKGGIDFGKGWKSLWYLDASSNYLEGSLMAPNTELTNLNLSHNLFTGNIPMKYCGLKELDLSFNNITGCTQFKTQCSNDLTLFC